METGAGRTGRTSFHDAGLYADVQRQTEAARRRLPLHPAPMMRLLTTLLLAAVCTACGGPSRDGNAFTFDEAGMAYRVEFRTENTVRILVRPAGSPLVTQRLVVDSVPAAPVEVRREAIEHGYAFRTPAAPGGVRPHAGPLLVPRRPHGRPAARGNRPLAPSRHRGRRGVLRRDPAVRRDRRRGAVRTGPVPDGRPELQTRHGPAVAGQQGHRQPLSGLHARLRTAVDNSRPRSCATEATLSNSRRRWATPSITGSSTGAIPARMRARLPCADRRGVDASEMGFRVLAVARTLQEFDELTRVVSEYRRRHIPIDIIVQDWEYWGEKPRWNALQWDSVRYPNPGAAVARLHEEYGVRLLVSVWPGFGPETAVYGDMTAGVLFDERTWAGYKVFDAYDPAARDIFWRHFRTGLFDTGIDGWWMDATEPSFREGFTQRKQEARTKSAGKTRPGSFPPLSEHLFAGVDGRPLRPSARGGSRTPSATSPPARHSPGSSVSGTAVWSGDIVASWETMKRQLAAGVEPSASGPLDLRHGRILRHRQRRHAPQAGRPGLQGALRPLVPVRGLPADLPRPRDQRPARSAAVRRRTQQPGTATRSNTSTCATA